MKPACPLCNHADSRSYFEDRHRRYWQCPVCRLVFVDPAQRLNASEEKAVYDLHQNNPHDAGYRQFLSRFYQPMRQRINAGNRGLDFGCGPGPTLSTMFAEEGFAIDVYDVFYADNKAVLQQHYHFICATEVVEHLFEPGTVLTQLWRMLLPGGTLGLMTKLVIDVTAFANWHYKNDPTHVCFFSVASFEWLARSLTATVEIIGSDVIFLTKQDS